MLDQTSSYHLNIDVVEVGVCLTPPCSWFLAAADPDLLASSASLLSSAPAVVRLSSVVVMMPGLQPC